MIIYVFRRKINKKGHQNDDLQIKFIFNVSAVSYSNHTATSLFIATIYNLKHHKFRSLPTSRLTEVSYTPV